MLLHLYKAVEGSVSYLFSQILIEIIGNTYNLNLKFICMHILFTIGISFVLIYLTYLITQKTSASAQQIKYGSLLLLTFVVLSKAVIAQAPAEADIFVVDLEKKGKSIKVGKPLNITKRKGYDNQPSFTPEGNSILYTSIREDGQADTYLYDLGQKTARQMTKTPESEYSPTVMPDNAHFSVVRVEKYQTQRLWQFPMTGEGEPALILENIKPVGYHCWLNADNLALFVLGEPNSLVLGRISSGDTTIIARNIGRGIYKIPKKNAVSFVYKRSPTSWDIKQLDLQTGNISTIIECLEGSEDFVWTPDNRLLMCKNAILYQYWPGVDQSWVQIADMNKYGIKGLNRLAINTSGTKLALVGQ
jgi:hypothetical protein